MIEGMPSELGLKYSVDNTKALSERSTSVSVLTIRNKSTYRGKTNFIPIELRMISYGSDGNKNSVITLYRDATLTGTPAWTPIHGDDSVVEYDTNADAVTGGIELASFMLGKIESRNENLTDLDIQILPGQTLTVAALMTAHGTSDVSVSIAWLEDR
jgi:hypothetical protein